MNEKAIMINDGVCVGAACICSVFKTYCNVKLNSLLNALYNMKISFGFKQSFFGYIERIVDF